MKEDTARGIQTSANIAIIITAVLLCTLLVKNYFSKASPSPTTGSQVSAPNIDRSRPDALIPPGTKVLLAGIDWRQNGQTLLLAVSDKCHFCSESAPFYQRLAHERGRTHLVAVLPQPVDEGRNYLERLNVSVDEIKQSPLAALGIRGTPTLILVDGRGTVTNTWIGKLSATREDEVLNSMRRLSEGEAQ